MSCKFPDWMSELYITVLRFGVPCDRLMFYRRPLHVNRAWTVGLVGKGYSNVNQFLRLLQEKDESEIDF